METADVTPGLGRMRFGINMHSLRRAKGLSQEKLAEACHLHRTYIGSVERGERNISIDNMERIAAGLGTDVADMLRAR
jgi:transcriptional regulator with XRE-family HTH domain